MCDEERAGAPAPGADCPADALVCREPRPAAGVPGSFYLSSVRIILIRGGYTFLSSGTVTWHNTYAPPGRGPGLAKLLLTSETPSVAPAIPGPRRSPLDPCRHRQCAPVGLVAPVSGLLFVCHRAPEARDLLFHRFAPPRVPALPMLSLSRDAQEPRAC